MPVRNPLKRIARRYLGTVTRVATRDKVVALTFDDGPEPDYTPALMDILELHGARATFFMVGKRAARYPELVASVHQRGHTIANHSWDHPSFPLLSSAEQRDQVRRCSSALGVGEQRLFRPPFGHQDLASRLQLWRLGYDVIAWNVLAEDWMDHSPEAIFQALAESLGPGNIMLLHDALFCTDNREYLDRRPTLDAVERLLSENPDYEFVTVPELMKRGRPVRTLWSRQGDREWLGRQMSWDENNQYER